MALAMTPGQVYESVKDSVVVVKAYDRQGKPLRHGSGVVLPSGDIVTNYHVVKGGVRYTVGRGKQVAPATLKAGDPDKDLCLLSAPGLVAEPARLGKTASLKVGDPVYAVGAPQGLELSLSEGIISQLRGGPPPLIQTTVAISPGSSGGGLFNAKGALVGITTFYMKDGQNLNFAVPVEWVAEVAGKKIRERPIGKTPTTSEPGAKPKGGREDWDSRALGYINQGRYGEAIEAYREALRLKPDLPAAWFGLGRAYGKLGRWGEAIEGYRESIRLRPDDADAWYNLGVAYANSGNRSAALEAVKELRRYDPKEADRLFNLIMKP